MSQSKDETSRTDISCVLISFVIAWTDETLKGSKEWRTEMELGFTCKADENYAVANFMKNKARPLSITCKS